MRYGVVVIGMPGSGKTTLTRSFADIFKIIKRPAKSINLDPANETDFDFDVQGMIQTADVQEAFNLGPNASLLYCLEFLNANFAVLSDYIISQPDCFFIFDLPGQVECYAADYNLREIMTKLQHQLDFSLVAVHLSDCAMINSASKYLQLQLSTLSIQTAFNLPFMNVFNKTDMLPHQQQLEDVLQQFEEELIYQPEGELGLELLQVLNNSGCIESSGLCALDSKEVVQLINDVDNRVGYSRGQLGEYKGITPAEVRQIEDYIDRAYL
ncbi:ATP-binding_protein [Hexamita inflata]|uniref:GPN-loop GTPase 2 n=1 Tax=Hexamita inflata TaxID=28002 RepID=A0AA86RND6_9EUKA|nr:ATP-binding protein [Hexamita inflata]